nr:GDSL-type esterase/lipase family protein [Bacillus sp. DNRA2]
MKYSLLLIIIIGISSAAWIYYPQFKINKLKQESVTVEKTENTISIFEHFRQLDQDEIYHLALGDSVIRGYGVNENENFVSRFSHQLSILTGKKVHFSNAGINGSTSNELMSIIKDGQLDAEIAKANIITINIGGNDILKGAKNLNYTKALEGFNQIQSTFTENLSLVSSRIKQINPNATVLFLELYNPMNPNDSLYSIADRLLPKWNINIYEVAKEHPGSLVIETTEVINGKNLQNLSDDGIHPNSNGHAAISELMINQLKRIRISAAV